MTTVLIRTTGLSITENIIGKLAMAPMTMPCSHQVILSALIPMVKPINVRLKIIVHLTATVICSDASGLELAKYIHTKPKINPQIVEMITRLKVSIFYSSSDVGYSISTRIRGIRTRFKVYSIISSAFNICCALVLMNA